MPGFNGTGPHGMGPMTGRGMGYCVIPLSMQQEELDYLKRQAKAIRSELQRIETLIRKSEKAKRAARKE
jgi:hypothetical protein